MTNKAAHGNERAGRNTKVFHKPYRLKPVEVYAEPAPGGCSREKTD